MRRKIAPTNGKVPDRPPVMKNPFFTTLVVSGEFPRGGPLDSFLEHEAYSVLRASSAMDAVEQTKLFQPDLILLDSEVEGAKGLELLPELLLEQVSAAIIILAKAGNVIEAVEAMKRGAVDYLARPLDTLMLKRAMDLQKALFASAAMHGKP